MKQYTTEQIKRTVACLSEIIDVLNKDEFFSTKYSMYAAYHNKELPLQKLEREIEETHDLFFQELAKREKKQLREYRRQTA